VELPIENENENVIENKDERIKKRENNI